MSQSRPLSVGTLKLTANVAISRFVQLDGTLSGAGEYSAGVSTMAGVSGDRIPFTELGSEIVETGGSFSVGAKLECDASGRAVAQSSGITVARARQASTGSGQKVEVWLIPN